MFIKNLTEEQGLEIVKLAYSWPELITDYTFTYQPYDKEWDRDAREFIRLKFKAPVFADKVKQLMIEINTDLGIYMYYWNGKVNDFLPVRNQYGIYQKFIEWGMKPSSVK